MISHSQSSIDSAASRVFSATIVLCPRIREPDNAQLGLLVPGHLQLVAP